MKKAGIENQAKYYTPFLTKEGFLHWKRKNETKLKVGKNTFILNEYKTKHGINYCLKDEYGEILMNIENSDFMGDRILIMTESFRKKGFVIQFIEK